MPFPASPFPPFPIALCLCYHCKQEWKDTSPAKRVSAVIDVPVKLAASRRGSQHDELDELLKHFLQRNVSSSHKTFAHVVLENDTTVLPPPPTPLAWPRFTLPKVKPRLYSIGKGDSFEQSVPPPRLQSPRNARRPVRAPPVALFPSRAA